MQKFTEKAKQIKLGDPFGQTTDQGPQVSQLQFDVSIDPSHDISF
jgi:aldehyde dehydrogenase (NAD+)